MPDGQGYVVVHEVWKRFRRGQLHDSLRDLVPALSRRLVRPSRAELKVNEFWAVSDLSFTVEPGEALGIIGGNGAGKSTTLKMLTRILRPTRGAFEVRGRVGALVEITAGFHGDLTGRENVFLQGAIMGMSQAHIRRKFDEIIEFSGIEEFLDTPVKRYSSGMHARLGFAIAAHLDPDVLIIDEVLAVGDFQFQDRAFSRIREMVTSGVPVVIVSHQLDRIASLCTKAIVLDHGTVRYAGTPADAIAHYLSGTRQNGTGDASAVVHVDTLHAGREGPVEPGGPVTLTMKGVVRGTEPARAELLLLRVRSTMSGQVVYGTTTERCGIGALPPGPFTISVGLEMNVRPGVYIVELYVVKRPANTEAPAGPTAYVHVRDDPGFRGTTHLNGTMRLVDAG
jgi:ABC-type polysaccharide/polyol phosphate transport system ATPase subunit